MTPLLVPVLAFAAAAAVLTLTPGVDTAMVLRASAAGGRRDGFAATAGICLGLLVWGAGAAFGLTALLAASRLAFGVVKWAGAAYLAWLGVRLILKPRSDWAEGAAGDRAQAGPGSAFRRGLLTNLLNPKVGVFYVTFLPQFIPHGENVAAVSLLLAGIHILLGLIWLSALTAMTARLGRLLRRPRVVNALDRLTGLVFIGFGVRLALTDAS
jgi:threonine/homoserine/homoserine lactone efflux protein